MSIFDECDSNDNYLLKCLLLVGQDNILLINHSGDHLPGWAVAGEDDTEVPHLDDYLKRKISEGF